MENSEISNYILSKIEEFVVAHGYKRSGKSGLFYRYSSDKRIACGIQMQKSITNMPGLCSFTFNLACISIDDVPDCWSNKLTLSQLKTYLSSVYSERIGFVCRGRDYWWTIDYDTLRHITLAEYFDSFIYPDIQKSVIHLHELTAKKEKTLK